MTSQLGHHGRVTTRLVRLVTLACALAAMLVLSLHVMAPAGSSAEATVHAAHGPMDGGDPSADQDGSPACAIHCLVAAVLPAAEVAHAPAPRPTLAPAARIRTAGLVPQPLGPPPKPVALA